MSTNQGFGYKLYALTDSGAPIDLVVTALGTYTPQKVQANSVKGSFAQVNVKSGTSVDLRFSFVNQQTGAAVVMESVYVTFFDLDLAESEVLTVSGFERYLMRSDAGEIVAGSGSTSAIEVVASGDGVRFIAKETGNAGDNPKDPLQLTALQQRRSVSLLFLSKSSFDARFEVLSGPGGRSVLFGGTSSLVTELCPEPPSPTVGPSLVPTVAPTRAPTPEGCGFDEWAAWGDCSVTCGGGSRQRTRAGSLDGVLTSDCPSENQTETDPLDESCLVSSCAELVCDPPGMLRVWHQDAERPAQRHRAVEGPALRVPRDGTAGDSGGRCGGLADGAGGVQRRC